MGESILLSGSTRILRESLSALSRRQQLIAGNLANVDTPGYRAYDLPFERVLEREERRGNVQLAMLATSPGHLSVRETTLEQALRPERQPALHSDGNGVDVDVEMAKLSQTAIEYNAVAQLMAARLAQLRAAVTEGRR